MKPEPSYPKHRAKFTLAACLAALLAFAMPLSAQTAADDLDTDDDVETLSEFEVSSDKDYGYLKTNSATATRIGMEIQKVPMNVSVLSREFLDDTNAKSLTDIFRYSAASSGDSRYAMRRPANEATPQGVFTMRGFAVNVIMRNGVFRYLSANLDNVERVEVVKGPAAVFFGQGYPGGVINYITKRPKFTKIPTTFRYSINDNSGQKLVIDHNAVLSKKAAFRVVGSWEDSQGERKWEFKKNLNITPSLTLKPFDEGNVSLTLEMEFLDDRYNKNDLDWIYGKHFNAWSAGHSIRGSSRHTSYGNFVKDVRNATGDQSIPYYTSIARGAYITDASGKVILDESFNWSGRGAEVHNVVQTFSADLEFSPFEWVTGRYNFTHDIADYNAIEGYLRPYANGINWLAQPNNLAGYYRDTWVHTLDLIFKFDLAGIKNTVLTGYTDSTWSQQYHAEDPTFNNTGWFGHVPGVYNAIANPAGAASILGGSANQVPPGSVIYDRYGKVKTIQDVYRNFDPGFETYPDISVALPMWRSVRDGYKQSLSAAYLNWQADWLDDRLSTIAGFRRETRKNTGQHAISAFPWIEAPSTAYTDTVTYAPSYYGYSAGYQASNFSEQEGDSWMGGLSYAVTDTMNFYASISKTFKFNSGNKGGQNAPDAEPIYASALSHGGGSYVYLGQTINSVAEAVASHSALGAFDKIANESGMNWEIGAKISNEDNTLVGTMSLFRGERTNQRLDDAARQSNAEEPYNRSTSLFAPSTTGYNRRNFRWRTTDLKNRIEGAEAEFIWTPMKNFQSVINASWLWTAKTIYDKTKPQPGTTRFLAGSAAQQAGWDIYYGARIENVPEYRFNMFNKYTFTDGPVRGASVGLGIRYSSDTVISRSTAWNPLNGGLLAGDYLVFDVTASYPWEALGYKIKTSIGIYNAGDAEYMEGRSALAPARNWLFTNTLSF
jgi:outer membrane receptor protein involved in Fe transport